MVATTYLDGSPPERLRELVAVAASAPRAPKLCRHLLQAAD